MFDVVLHIAVTVGTRRVVRFHVNNTGESIGTAIGHIRSVPGRVDETQRSVGKADTGGNRSGGQSPGPASHPDALIQSRCHDSVLFGDCTICLLHSPARGRVEL